VKAAARLLPPGSRLPSVRELTARHRASPVTVQRAITRLAAEGVVDPRPGRGTFVAERAPVPPAPDAVTPGPPDLSWQEVALGARAPAAGGLADLLTGPAPGVITLSAAYLDPTLQPIGALTSALTRAGRRDGAWDHTPIGGLPDLRAWFVRAAGDFLRADDVVLCPGSQAALATAFRVLVESPTSLGALAAARAAGLRPVPVPADADGVRPGLLADAFARTGARLLYLQPTFADPHGTVLAPERRTEVLDVVAAAGAFAIEDDAARDLAIDGDAPPPLAADDRDGHVVLVRSLTRSAAAGLRVGALAARGAAGTRLRAARLVDDPFVAGPLQLAALELVSSPGWRRHRRDLRTALRTRRDALVAALARDLPGARVAVVPAGGLHLWLALPDGVDDVALAALALGAGVAVSAGRPWFPADPPAAHMRLTYAAAPEADLAEGVRRLASVAPAPLTA
jgi:DNA-binding transcriptional MocR family regulator